MKIKITEFAERHFDKNFGGTKILDFNVEEFENRILSETLFLSEDNTHIFDEYEDESLDEVRVKMIDGYAPFCKLVAIKNFTEAKVGSLPITLENYQYLRSGYSARRESELPIFSRWLELPLGKPKADYLMLVLYSKEQIDKEAKTENIKNIDKKYKSDYELEYDKYDELNELDCFSDNFEDWLDEKHIEINYPKFDADWGIVAILGQSHIEEEPMKPETMIRNSYMSGGSDVEFNEEDYLKSVNFWSNNATVK